MRITVCLVICLLTAIFCPAQSVDATKLGGPVDLGVTWLFHSGDDPRWSLPGADDSHWQTVAGDLDWYVRDARWKGAFWYRLHVRLAPDHGPLALYMGVLYSPTEVFANGVRVASAGEFPPGDVELSPRMVEIDIPPAAVRGQDLTLAIRFYSPPQLKGGWGGVRGKEANLLGTVDQIRDHLAKELATTYYTWVPDLLIRFASLLLACGLLVLFWWQRDLVEYLWIAGYFFAMICWSVQQCFRTVGWISLFSASMLDNGFATAAQMLLIEFVFAFLRQKVPLWLRIYQLTMPLSLVLVWLAFHADSNWSALNVLGLVWSAPYAFLLPFVLIWRFFKGRREAGLLFIPLLLINLNDMLDSIGSILFDLGMRHRFGSMIPSFHMGVVPVYFGEICGLLFLVSIAALLLHRFHKTGQDRARAQSELDAARTMQDVMVPRHLQSVADFAIESAYVPAQEVGGDFFQLYPGSDGSLLIVIGDVSGKGVKAAMLVSMILGVLQRTVQSTRSPKRILEDLNRCIVGHTDEKFATCCCALLFPDGRVMAANAGHLSPYCDGAEVELPGGLPLGLALDAEYEEVELHLPPGRRWLFLSDGVVEARSESGELYGFERTRSISVLPVAKIVESAQQFGQEDDITVLGVAREAAACA